MMMNDGCEALLCLVLVARLRHLKSREPCARAGSTPALGTSKIKPSGGIIVFLQGAFLFKVPHNSTAIFMHFLHNN